MYLLILSTLFSLQASATDLLKKHVSRPLQAEATLEALAPWETPIDGFFIRSHHGVPNISEQTWTLTIDGLVEKPITLKLSDLKKLKQKTFHAVLECSGNGRALQVPAAAGVQWRNGAIGNAEWSGVALADVLALARPKKNAKFITIEGADVPAKPSVPRFVRSIPLEKALELDTLLALKMNREPLTALHGAPARLVLPGWYAQNWIKWITHITLTDAEDSGFYMKKGYRKPLKPLSPGEAWDSGTGTPIQEILVQSFFVSPEPEQVLKKGTVQFRGKAFSGAGQIAKVEVSLDSGKTWALATLSAAHASGGWQEFEMAADFFDMGAFVAMARATDEKGNVQPLEHNWNPGGYMRNSVDPLPFKIQDEAAPSGLALMKAKCLTCHTSELIESQRLTHDQWSGVVKKMEGFGVELAGSEKQVLVTYLEKYSPEQIKCDTHPMVAPAEELALRPLAIPLGKSARGEKLFAQNCAACHGDDGKGRIGPAIHVRNVPSLEFWQTVLYGKREMPAFSKQIRRQDIADIQAYLARKEIP